MPRAARRSLAVAALLCLAPALFGCAPGTRYKILSFFFDGVPPPEGVQEARPGSAGGGPAPAPTVVYVKHAPYAKKQCQGCHNPSTNALIADAPQLCLGCHKMRLKESRYLHAPVVAGFCRLCHDPHGSRYPFLLVAAPRDMCFYCHNPEDVARNKAHDDAQAPCTQCHNPHADNRFFLRVAAPTEPATPAEPAAPAAPTAPAAPGVPAGTSP